ncbi:uncharacterized protein TRAVEDRAFT_126211 [Trametes versicolor FP-101664 SS1]|uniref:uncharacterized protein n=1 Tax=Trametes versicolor (strain FP-101664) TaxID=717944 RepID=UPI0004623812|nr:uncharacterized protein TRAVEDRAFT_126211 [Trametes versicolor FP-101664 SS1]EIW57161.1 hypothetical protein TRAVEDRAFT_126211 [Trametes versicolor FP-101664 SS1]
MAAWDIYAEKLFPLGYGHPLWAPGPSTEFGEVHIGDVGFLLPVRFRFLFNCTLAPGDLVNQRGTPTPFEPFMISIGALAEIPNEITQPLLQSQGMQSISVEGRGGAQASLRYKCSQQSGALLMLKQAGHATRLDCTRAIQKYMRQNLEHWHLFATEELGIDLRDSDLIFVSGYIKTTIWAEAAFSSSTTDGELNISAGASLPVGASGSFSVELSNCQLPLTFHRHGPSGRAMAERALGSPALTSDTSAADAFDQCIFLNYFRMKGRFLRKVMRAAAGPHELPSPPPDDLPTIFGDTQSGQVRASDLNIHNMSSHR